MKKYFQSEEYKNVSFSSLYLLLYYFYKKKYKNNKLDFEKKFDLEKYFESIESLAIDTNTETQKESLVVKYLGRYLNDNDRFYKMQAHKLCHHLNITLNLSKIFGKVAPYCCMINSVKSLIVIIFLISFFYIHNLNEI